MGYQFIGREVNDNAGVSVASSGDVDGDGKADLIIGARSADGGGSSSGEAYLMTAADLAAAEAAVEALQIGDLVRTADGREVPVKWIGRETVYPHFGFTARLEPVCIAAGALGGGLPKSDLYLSADHGMILDGLVINAGALVNGTTIRFVPGAELPAEITYYHIETEDHDVILANGAPAETFVDYVGRRAFDNYAEYVEMYGAERIIPEMDRPRISAQRLVPEAIKARLGIADEVFDFDELLSA